ncbi:MAG: hypothetical protein MRY81_24450 [Donghicola eburneus]|nr:hypothetical protein [Donghicola eburneus]MCI5042804.1 hypothetical protein [Donghicola eburneus]
MTEYLKAPIMHPDYEAVGRMLENCFGTKETIVLHANYWDFFDFMVEEGYDMQAWLKEIDASRPADAPLSAYLMSSLWHLECDRYREGLSCPASSPPMGYEE